MNNLYKSLTIEERSMILKIKKITEVNRDALNKWRTEMSILGNKEFYAMLDERNLSECDFSRAVNKNISIDEINILNKCVLKKVWYKMFEDIMETKELNILNLENHDLIRIFDNFISYAYLKINQNIEDKKINFINQDVLNSLVIQLGQKLLVVAHKCIILELNHQREESLLEGSNSEERYRYFVNNLSMKENLLLFFDKYIVLARLLTVQTKYFINLIDEIFSNISSDKDKIIKEFDIPNFTVVRIIIGQGDTHNEGKTVTIIEFNDRKIVYKPRNSDVSIIYNKVIDTINKDDSIYKLKYAKTLSLVNYSYEEFIAYEACSTDDDLTEFYIRFGEMIGLMYILNASDMHMENLVAHGKYPIIVDLETLIQVPNLLGKKDITESLIKEYFSSVERTCLVSGDINFNNKPNAKINVSALAGRETILTEKSLQIVNKNTDMMHMEMKNTHIGGSLNLPVTNTENFDSKLYYSDIILGFELMYSYFQKNNSIFKNLLNDFKNRKIRVLVRNTQLYGSILNQSYHPDLLTDMLDREKVLENMWCKKAEQSDILLSEYKDMLYGDIPTFYMISSNNILLNGRGKPVRRNIELPLDALVNTFNKVSEIDKEKQISLIKISVFSNPFEYKQVDDKLTDTPLKERIVTNILIKQYLEEIMKNTIKSKNTVSFMSLQHISNCFKWNMSPTDFYEGSSGVALNFYWGWKIFKDENYKQIFESLLYYELENFNSEILNNIDNYGYSCPFGMIHTLSYIDMDLEGFVEIENYIKTYITTLDNQLNKDLKLDYVNGLLGIGFSLLRLHYKIKEIELIPILIKVAESILADTASLLQNIGFAHGISGLYLYLIKLWKLTGIKKYYTHALLLIEKENKQLDENTINSSWCRGLTGICMSRIECVKHVENINDKVMLKHTIDTLHEKIINTTLFSKDCLCHGNLSIFEYLITAYDFYNDDNLKSQANNLMEYILINNNFESLPQLCNVSLFTGVGGLVYELFRLQYQNEIPSIVY